MKFTHSIPYTNKAEAKAFLKLADKLSKAEKELLVKYAAVEAERAYRRGFNQGLYARDIGSANHDDEVVYKWRYEGNLLKSEAPPFDTSPSSYTAVERHFDLQSPALFGVLHDVGSVDINDLL